MSDDAPLTPPILTPAPETPGNKRLRIALAVSVALNLGVVGLLAGAALHGGGMAERGGVRELGFGPFTEALNRDERQDLRRAFLAKVPDFRNARRQMRADTQALLTALRADPFDPAALTAAMETQRVRLVGQLELGQTLVRDLLVDMTPEARLAFADRLEERLHHPGKASPKP